MAAPFYNTAITSSRTTIRRRVDENFIDQTFSGGNCLMSREFDESTIASGSWTEIWVGVRWRINMDFPLSRSVGGDAAVPDVWGHPRVKLGIGICDTTGKIWGEVSQSSALNDSKPAVSTDNSHSLFVWTGYQASDWDLYRYDGPTPARYDTTITYSYALTALQAVINATGSKRSFPNAGQAMAVPLNCPTSSQRNFFAVRFATSSGDPKTWQVDSVFPTGTSSLMEDFSGSNRLVDLMKFNSWQDFTAYATWLGYNNYNHGEQKVDQAAHGFFDGVFFFWNRNWDTIEISDIIVRAITSSATVAW